MSRKLSTLSMLTRYSSLTTTTTTTTPTGITTSDEIINNDKQSKIQRWILGMIIGSAPFFIILFSWMFVSVCMNNFARFYQYRRKQYRRSTQNNEFGNIVSKINI